MTVMLCPICRQPTTWEGNTWRPFCSERCQITDLGTWAAEEYRIPGSSLTTETELPEMTQESEKSGKD